MESANPAQVQSIYAQWSTIEGRCKELLARVVEAIELFEEATDKKFLAPGKSPAERICFGDRGFRDIPYVRNHIGPAEMLAKIILLSEPGLDKMLLCSLEATEKLTPGFIREDELERIRLKVKAHDEKYKNGQEKKNYR